MLALDPALVRLERAEPGHTGAAGQAFTGGLRAPSPNGVLGDPRGATVVEGAELLARLSAELIDAFDAWRAESDA